MRPGDDSQPGSRRRASVILLAGFGGMLVLGPTAGGEGVDTAAAQDPPPKVAIRTYELPPQFRAPWQLAWIPDGTDEGAVAFTDRSGNQVGVLDPTTGNTQAITLRIITNPSPIAVIDQNRFAIAGTGGVGIFDRRGAGTIRELQMTGTRNTVVAVGSEDRLFVADAQLNDLRIIRAPYSGPADITRFPLPSQCRGPAGVIPGTARIDILCGQTNNIVRIDYTGNFGSSTPLPLPNMGAQEARRSPTGFVFSGFDANRVTAWGSEYPDPYDFINILLSGPAVPTVGVFTTSEHFARLAAASALLGRGKRPARDVFYNTVTPSYRGAGISFGTFRSGAAKRALVGSGSILKRLEGKNLVGSANGPGGSILIADATPGKPAIHRLSFADPKATRTRTGYRYPTVRLTQTDPDFLARMSMPFFGPLPRSTPPKEVQVGIVGASSSPWNLKPIFGGNFNLKTTATAKLAAGGSYKAKVQSVDTGPYTRVVRITNIRANTSQLSLELRGKVRVPVTFVLNAQAIRG